MENVDTRCEMAIAILQATHDVTFQANDPGGFQAN